MYYHSALPLVLSAIFNLFFSERNVSMDSKSTKGSGWQHIKTSDGETYAIIFDIHIIYEEDYRK